MRALLGLALVGCAPSSPTTSSVEHKLVCGPHTHVENGVCVQDAVVYEIAASSMIVANEKPVDVVVFGRHADGTVATDKIVLNTSRANAGTFDPPTFDLNDQHARAKFTPCSASTPGCVGPLELIVALASAPTVPIARIPVSLVATPAVGSIEPCLTGGNVLHLDGDDFINRGAVTVVDAVFQRAGGTKRGEVIVLPTNPVQGTKWTFEISSVELGTTLAPGVYAAGGQGASFQVFGENPYSACRATQGEFQVHDFVFTTVLQRMTVSFRAACTNNPNVVVTGCIHVE